MRADRIRCPECRQYTNLSEVKKDFKMETLIGIFESMSENDDKPQETVCDVCEDSIKPVESFCTNCEELLCVDCSKAHRGSKVSKNHKLITFAELQQLQKQEIHEHIKVVRDEMKEMDGNCTSNTELIENIKQAEMRQIAEVNRLRQNILDDVNKSHDSLIKEIQSINQEPINALQVHQQMFTEARQLLADKIVFLEDVSETHNVSVVIDMLKNLSGQLREELAAIRSKLPRIDRNIKSLVQVTKGDDWNPVTSTRIEVAGSAAKDETVSRSSTQGPSRDPSSLEEAGRAAAGGRESRGLSNQEEPVTVASAKPDPSSFKQVTKK